MDQLILKRANASRPSGHWSDHYDVLSEGEVVGRMKVIAAQRIRRGCGRWPMGSTATARQRTASSRRARLRWPPSLRAGGENRALTKFTIIATPLWVHRSPIARDTRLGIMADLRPMSSAPLDGTPVRLFGTTGSAIGSFWSPERSRKAFGAGDYREGWFLLDDDTVELDDPMCWEPLASDFACFENETAPDWRADHDLNRTVKLSRLP
jgi:hypothetical protein